MSGGWLIQDPSSGEICPPYASPRFRTSRLPCPTGKGDFPHGGFPCARHATPHSSPKSTFRLPHGRATTQSARTHTHGWNTFGDGTAPCLSVHGHWLENAGFKVGASVSVEATVGQPIITLVELPSSTQQRHSSEFEGHIAKPARARLATTWNMSHRKFNRTEFARSRSLG